MKKVLIENAIMVIAGLTLTGLLGTAYAGMAPGHDIVLNAANDREAAPLVLQPLDYTENPVDIPNPDKGFEREGMTTLPAWELLSLIDREINLQNEFVNPMDK
ncbi:MAG: hypothetical protein WD097_00010 [Balneolales bacterium]